MLQIGGIVVLFACVFGGYLMTGGSLAVVFEAMPHGGFGVTSEDAELDAEVRRFVDAHW